MNGDDVPALTAANLLRPFTEPERLRAFLADWEHQPSDLAPWRRAQLHTFCPGAFGFDQAPEDEVIATWATLVCLDLATVRSGTLAYQLYVWSGGCAALFAHAELAELGYAVQHGFVVPSGDDNLHVVVGLAYLDAVERHGLRREIDF